MKNTKGEGGKGRKRLTYVKGQSEKDKKIKGKRRKKNQSKQSRAVWVCKEHLAAIPFALLHNATRKDNSKCSAIG
jgi:hypothetical protein